MIWSLILAIEDEQERSIAEELFLTRYDIMYTQANKILKNEADAHDAVMKAFENIIEHVQKFSGTPENNDRLIYIYTRNAAIDIYRQRKTKGTISLDHLFNDDEGNAFSRNYADPDADLEKLIINAETIAQTRKAMAQLPLAYREVIYLRYFNEYSCADIANVLSISIETVWTRIHRAKNALKELLKNELSE